MDREWETVIFFRYFLQQLFLCFDHLRRVDSKQFERMVYKQSANDNKHISFLGRGINDRVRLIKQNLFIRQRICRLHFCKIECNLVKTVNPGEI